MTNRVTDTRDVNILLGNPKRALIVFMGPALLSFMVQNTDMLIDTMWVSGLGSGALAAVGYVTPIFTIQCGIGAGVGVGASVIISNAIGEGNRDLANRILGQTILICILISAFMMILLTLFGESFLNMMSSGHYLDESISYLTPLIITCPCMILGLAFSNITRSEGGFKRVMLALILTALFNGIIDPLLIYGLDMGVTGAAWATGLSRGVCTLVLLSFMLSPKTYLKIDLNRFRISPKVVHGIFRVGIPATFSTALIAAINMILNTIITGIDPQFGIAAFGSMSKMFQFLIIPAMALGASLLPISSAAIGQKRYDKISEVYWNSIAMGLAMMTIIAIVVFIGAEQLTTIFTYSNQSPELKYQLILAFRSLTPVIAMYSMFYLASFLFQSLGRGVSGLMGIAIQNASIIVMVIIVTSLVKSMESFWISYSIGTIIGGFLVFLWTAHTVHSLKKRYEPVEPQPST